MPRRVTVASESLRASEARLKSIVEHLNEGLGLYDPEGNMIYWNRAALAIMGFSGEEDEQEFFRSVPDRFDVRTLEGELLPPEEWPPRRVVRGEEVKDLRIRVFNRETGVERILNCGGTLIRNAAGEPELGILTLHDDTERVATLEALAQSEARYRELVQNANSAIVRWNRDGTITFFNDFAQRIFGYTADEALGANINMLVPERDSKGNDLSNLINSITFHPDQYYENVNENICKDGRRVWMTWTNRPILDDSGQVQEILAIGMDTTARKQAEDALRERELELQLLMDTAPALISYIDCSMRYGRVNNQYIEWFGLSPDKIKGQSVAEVVGPLAWETVRPYLERALTGETVVYERQVNYEDKPRWVHVSYTPHFNASHEVLGVVAHIVDISDLKRTEEALRRSESVLAQAGYMAHLGAWEIEFVQSEDVNANPLHWSDEVFRIFGYEPHEVEPSNDRFFSHVHPEDREKVRQAVAVAIETKTPYAVEHRIITRAGKECFVFEHAQIYFGEDGQPVRIVGAVQDITEQKRYERELHRAQAELEERVQQRTVELSSTVAALKAEIAKRTSAEEILRERSVQLRALASQLTLVEQQERQRLAQILHDGLQQTLVSARFLLGMMGRHPSADVRDRANEISELISDCIDTSRSVTAEISPPILLQGGLVPALEWLARWMENKYDLKITLEALGPLEMSENMSILLFQAARELLFNVKKHAGVNEARCEVRRLDSQIELVVADQGNGFDPAVIGPKPGDTGGFGLFSIRERFEMLGGSMQIETAAGQGSRFTLTVPAPVEEKLQQKGELARATIGPDHLAKVNPIRLMLVDDHLLMRQGLSSLLAEEEDLEIVAEADHAQAAIRLARELQPDVMLMDVSMPGMSGIEATKIIHGELPDIQIIGLSMYNEAGSADAMLQAGAVDYMDKNGPSEALVARIRACRASSRLQDE